MGISFRLLHYAPIDIFNKPTGPIYLFGVTCPFEDEDACVEVLSRYPGLQPLAAVASGLRSHRRKPSNELYWASLGVGWPEAMKEFGVHRLRCLLCGEGWEDRSELPVGEPA